MTRTAWALNVKSRTLRAEIDLHNPGSKLLPGMYAYAEVVIEHPGAWAVPVAAVTYHSNRAYCWAYVNGKAVRTEIQTGASDGDWIEVVNRRAPGSAPGLAGKRSWTRITGSEQVILGDLSLLAEGTRVEIVPAATEANVAKAAFGGDAATPR